ncbi:MAG: hypothetical protein PWQ77_1130 [Kosmotogales bacterium]|nr:hypothetical protein [Kosmotogales bacterium]
MNVAELFIEKSKRKNFYNIMPIENIPSVMKHGILSNYNDKKTKHESVASVDVQSRRENKMVPNVGNLHSYANCYFDCRNPMMYKIKIKNMIKSICVLIIKPEILNIEGVVISDRNASSDYAYFAGPWHMISNDKLQYDKIYARYWNDVDQKKKYILGSIKCAEVLVPNSIPYEYVESAIVFDEGVKNKLSEKEFDKEIFVNADLFFGG